MARSSPSSFTMVLDTASAGLAWGSVALVNALFAGSVVLTLLYGFQDAWSWTFLTEEPRSAGRIGGIAPMIVSTLWIVTISLMVSVPLGVGTAIWLAEYGDHNTRMRRYIRLSLDLLAAVPSVVFGLFGSLLFCQLLGMGYSILAGGLTLACMVLPILIRISEVGLRDVPQEYRDAAMALGMRPSTMICRIVLPAAMPTVVAAILLSMGRAMAETAALLFTSGYVTRMPESVMDSGRTLSVHIYEMAMNVPDGDGRAYGSAVVLIVMLLVINWVATAVVRIAGWQK